MRAFDIEAFGLHASKARLPNAGDPGGVMRNEAAPDGIAEDLLQKLFNPMRGFENAPLFDGFQTGDEVKRGNVLYRPVAKFREGVQFQLPQ